MKSKIKITPRTRCAKMKIRVSAKAEKALRKLARQQKTSPSEIAVRAIRKMAQLPHKTVAKIWQTDVLDTDKKTAIIYPRLWSDDLNVMRSIAKRRHSRLATIARRAVLWQLEIDQERKAHR